MLKEDNFFPPMLPDADGNLYYPAAPGWFEGSEWEWYRYIEDQGLYPGGSPPPMTPGAYRPGRITPSEFPDVQDSDFRPLHTPPFLHRGWHWGLKPNGDYGWVWDPTQPGGWTSEERRFFSRHGPPPDVLPYDGEMPDSWRPPNGSFWQNNRDWMRYKKHHNITDIPGTGRGNYVWNEELGRWDFIAPPHSPDGQPVRLTPTAEPYYDDGLRPEYSDPIGNRPDLTPARPTPSATPGRPIRIP